MLRTILLFLLCFLSSSQLEASYTSIMFFDAFRGASSVGYASNYDKNLPLCFAIGSDKYSNINISAGYLYKHNEDLYGMASPALSTSENSVKLGARLSVFFKPGDIPIGLGVVYCSLYEVPIGFSIFLKRINF